MSDAVQEQKQQVRRRLRASRSQLSPQEIAQRGLMLRDALQAHINPLAVVAGYVPLPGEPDVMPFLHAHSGLYGSVYLPMIDSTGSRNLRWGWWNPGTALQPGALLPVLEPVDDCPGSLADLAAQAAQLHLDDHDRWRSPLLPDPTDPPAQLVILVPALAIDTYGARMGQGGGFYDTTLAGLDQLIAKHPGLRCEVIAVVHSGEVLDPGSFPVEDHDLRVSQAATEYRVFTL